MLIATHSTIRVVVRQKRMLQNVMQARPTFWLTLQEITDQVGCSSVDMFRDCVVTSDHAVQSAVHRFCFKRWSSDQQREKDAAEAPDIHGQPVVMTACDFSGERQWKSNSFFYLVSSVKKTLKHTSLYPRKWWNSKHFATGKGSVISPGNEILPRIQGEDSPTSPESYKPLLINYYNHMKHTRRVNVEPLIPNLALNFFISFIFGAGGRQSFDFLQSIKAYFYINFKFYHPLASLLIRSKLKACDCPWFIMWCC